MLKMMRTLVSISVLTALLFLDVKPVTGADQMSMVLQWEHQSQFAGYYMALEKGYYANEKLDVQLIAGGADVDPLQLVRSGQADFCSAMLASVLGNNKKGGDHLVLLQQVLNRSNLTLVAWNKGRLGDAIIEKPSDLDGKRITLWEGFHAPYEAFFHQYHISPEIIPQYYTFSLFLRHGADACSAMRYNEVHSIKQNNINDNQLTIFDFHSLGIGLPEDGIYALDQTCQNRPQVCSAFARASLKGWEYAQQHPQETLDVVMRYVEQDKLPINRAHMKWMLKVILESIFPGQDSGWQVGKLSQEQYSRALTIMRAETSAPSYHDFVSKEAQHGVD